MKSQVAEIIEDRERHLDELRDIAQAHAERLVDEHVRQISAIRRGGVLTTFRPQVDGKGCWGFRLYWRAVTLIKSGSKWIPRSKYVKLNADGTIDPRSFSQIIPEERVLLELYEPEYVKIRQFMNKLTTQRRMGIELLKQAERIEGLEQWVSQLVPDEFPIR